MPRLQTATPTNKGSGQGGREGVYEGSAATVDFHKIPCPRVVKAWLPFNLYANYSDACATAGVCLYECVCFTYTLYTHTHTHACRLVSPASRVELSRAMLSRTRLCVVTPDLGSATNCNQHRHQHKHTHSHIQAEYRLAVKGARLRH